MKIDRVSLLIFVKYPRSGFVKTRLAASIGDQAAAELYRDFVSISLQRIQQLDGIDCTIYFDPPEEEDAFHQWLGGTYQYLPQTSGDLGSRLYSGFETQLKQYKQVIAIGTDSPDLPLQYIRNACEHLKQNDMVIGPAEDGGYYLIGLSKLVPGLFRDIPWSTSQVYEKTLTTTRSLQLSTEILPFWYDIDTVDDFRRLIHTDDFYVKMNVSKWRKITGLEE